MYETGLADYEDIFEGSHVIERETTKVEKAEPTNEKAEEDEDGIKYTPVGQYPIVDEKITLTAMMPSIGWIPDMETNEVILKVNEQKSSVFWVHQFFEGS